MNHIAGHFQDFDTKWRPDHFVIKYMQAKGLMTPEDYTSAMAFTERPEVDGLVPIGFETPEKKIKNEKALRQHYDLEKEKRQMQKEHRSNGYRNRNDDETHRRSNRGRTSHRVDIKH